MEKAQRKNKFVSDVLQTVLPEMKDISMMHQQDNSELQDTNAYKINSYFYILIRNYKNKMRYST